jgi:hypothetical protein
MKKVYQAINAVQAELSKEGIGKDRSNQQQGYKFRGIDDVFNALSPLLSRHGLCILPRCTERVCVERTNAKGTALFYVTVRAEFDFVSAEDGSLHTVTTYGEAMDSGDKATNKAMSAAYKYAAMQAFSIPTEGDNDADAQTHEVQARQTQHRQMDPRVVADWIGYIAESATAGELKTRLADACAAAEEIGDFAAAEKFSVAANAKVAAAKNRKTEGAQA